MKKNITFIIFAYNEEKRIEYVVKNCIPYGKVLILDDGSTDATEIIARETGADFIRRPKTQSKIAENQEMYEFIKKNVDTDWIFWGFCDNLMPHSLLEKFVELSQQNKIKYVISPIYTYLWGKTKHPAIKARSTRFFMKNYIDFTNNRIHYMGKFLGTKDETLRLPMEDKYAIRHYSLYDMNKFIISHLNYAEIEAAEKFKNGEKFGFLKMLKGMGREIIFWYKDGYKNGVTGCMVVLMYLFFRFMIFFKLYELENNLTLDKIEVEFDKEKKNLIYSK